MFTLALLIFRTFVKSGFIFRHQLEPFLDLLCANVDLFTLLP